MENLRDIKKYDNLGKIEEHKLEIKLNDDNLSEAVYNVYCANSIIVGTSTKAERSTIDLARIINRLEDAVEKINLEINKFDKIKKEKNKEN